MATVRRPITFSVTPGPEVTTEQLSDCATFFSEYYGIWGPKAKELNGHLKPGSRVKMSVSKLISECFPTKDDTNLATCTGEGGVLLGHAFGTTWRYSSGKVLWITQLVVHPQYRKRGIATFLLRSLRHPDHTALGIASSHPAACLAALRSTKTSILDLDLSFVQSSIRSVLDTSPVQYIATAKPCGSLFGSEEHGTSPPAESPREVINGRSEPICTLFTSFYVDHAEIKAGLEEWKATYTRAGKEQEWPLGGLREGHEYLVLVKCS